MLCACSKPADTATTTGTTTSGDPAPKAAAKPEDQVVGTWKVDIAATTVVPTDAKGKAEEAAMRVEVKADGSYTTSGMDKPDSGKWALKDHVVTFTPAAGGTSGPPPMTLSDDGSKLTATMPGDKPLSIVMVKA